MSRRINLLLGVLFLIVGLLAVGNTFRLNTYIRETLPRDSRQDLCDSKTVLLLEQWVQAREARDAALDRKDAASLNVLEHLVNKEKLDPGDIVEFRDALIALRALRPETKLNQPEGC